HVGTLLAVVVFYRDSIADIVRDTWTGLLTFLETRSFDDLFAGDGARVALFVVVATIPTGIMGLMLDDLLDPGGDTRIITAPVVFAVLIVNGFILITHRWIRERGERPAAEFTVWNLTLSA